VLQGENLIPFDAPKIQNFRLGLFNALKPVLASLTLEDIIVTVLSGGRCDLLPAARFLKAVNVLLYRWPVVSFIVTTRWRRPNPKF
jgi:hypothetical protein